MFREEYGDELKEAIKSGVIICVHEMNRVKEFWIWHFFNATNVTDKARIKGESGEFKKKASLVQGIVCGQK